MGGKKEENSSPPISSILRGRGERKKWPQIVYPDIQYILYILITVVRAKLIMHETARQAGK